MRHRLGRLPALLGLAAGLFLYAAPVSAHAVLLRAEPANGSVQATGPVAMRLYFSEEIEAEFTPLVVRDQRGARVDAGDARVDPGDPKVLVAGLKPLAEGFYTATYRITSVDGHPVQGTLGFSVGAAPAAGQPAPARPAGETPTLVPAAGLSHGAVQAACIGLAGLLAFALLIWLPAVAAAGVGAEAAARFRRWLWWLLAALLLAGVAELAIYAVRASGESLSPALLAQALLRTRVGQQSLWRAGAALFTAAAGAWALRRSHRAAPWLAGGAAALLLLTLSLQSHAAADGTWFTIAADWLHLLAVSPWVGGLLGFCIGLAAFPREERPRFLTTAVPRFSRLALLSVTLLALTGTYAALLRIPSLAGLTGTPYGRSLLIKLGLLLPLLALGARNLLRRGRGTFRRWVAAELVLAAGILIVTGFLSSLPPARVALLQVQGPFQATQAAGPLSVTLQIEPFEVGFSTATITVRNADGSPVADAYVGLRLTMTDPTHPMGLQNPDAVAVAPGVYQVADVVLAMGGEWQVQAVVLTRQGQEFRTTFMAPVPELTVP